MPERSQQAQRNKEGAADTKHRLREPKAGLPIKEVAMPRDKKTYVKGGTVVTPVRDPNRTTDGI